MNLYSLQTFNGGSNILEIGSWVPDEIIRSTHIQGDISRYSGSDPVKFLEKTGVVERRAASANVTVLDMAELASLDVISRLSDMPSFSAESIDTIIYSSVFRMYSEPATAALLQKRLGIGSAISFDVSNACLSFIDGLIIADSFIKAGVSSCVLVVSSEKVSTVLKNSLREINENDNNHEFFASLTLGDGAAAAIICSDEFSECSRLKLKAYSRTTISDYAECCILPTQQHPMSTDSAAMFRGAIKHYPDMFKKLIRDIGWRLNDIDMIVPHQASLKILREGMAAINYPFERCAVTLDSFGNMASVSVPFTLKKSIESGSLGRGSRIGILGFGSGLSFSMMAMEVNNSCDFSGSREIK